MYANTQMQIHKCKYTNTNTQMQIHKYKYIIHKLTYILMQRTQPTTNCAMISSSANLGPITNKQLFPKQRKEGTKGKQIKISHSAISSRAPGAGQQNIIKHKNLFFLYNTFSLPIFKLFLLKKIFTLPSFGEKH